VKKESIAVCALSRRVKFVGVREWQRLLEALIEGLENLLDAVRAALARRDVTLMLVADAHSAD